MGRSPYTLMPPMVVWGPTTRSRAMRSICREPATFSRAGFRNSPRYEITDTKDKYQIAVDVPGVKPDDISVSIENDGKVLSIAGERRQSTSDEYSYVSKFAQRFCLDPTVDIGTLSRGASLNYLAKGILLL